MKVEELKWTPSTIYENGICLTWIRMSTKSRVKTNAGTGVNDV